MYSVLHKIVPSLSSMPNSMYSKELILLRLNCMQLDKKLNSREISPVASDVHGVKINTF